MSRKDATEPRMANLHRLRQKTPALWEYHRNPYSRTPEPIHSIPLFHAEKNYPNPFFLKTQLLALEQLPQCKIEVTYPSKRTLIELPSTALIPQT